MSIVKPIKGYFSGISRNTILLALASLFSDIATEMLYPILPIFLTQHLNAGGSVVGLIEGIAQAVQNIMQGFSGWLADKTHKTKSIAAAGYLLGALAKPLIGLSTSWQGVLGGRFLDRLGTGLRSAPRDALLAASVSQDNRGKAFGLEGFGDNLGAFLGPLLAIFLLIFLKIDIHYIFYLAFIPGILAFFLVLFVKQRAAEVKVKSTIEVSLQPFPASYWKYLLVTAVFGMGNFSSSFLILQTQSITASLTTTIFIYASFNLVAALVSYPAGLLSDMFGRRNILLASFIFHFFTFLGFVFANSIVLIAVLFVLYGIFQGIFRTVGKSLAIDLVPAKLHASGVGWYSATIGLLGLFASIIAGLLWDNVGHGAAFLFGAVFSITGCVILIWLVPSKTLT